MLSRPMHFTKTGVLLAAALLVAGCGGGHKFVAPAPDARPAYVIRNVRVFDAPHAALLEGLRDVEIRDGQIAAIATPGHMGPGSPKWTAAAGRCSPVWSTCTRIRAAAPIHPG